MRPLYIVLGSKFPKMRYCRVHLEYYYPNDIIQAIIGINLNLKAVIWLTCRGDEEDSKRIRSGANSIPPQVIHNLLWIQSDIYGNYAL